MDKRKKILEIIKKVLKIIIYIFSAIGFITTLLFSCSAITSNNNDQQQENNKKPIQTVNIVEPSEDYFAKANELVLTMDKRQRLRNNILGGYTYEIIFGQYHTDLYRSKDEILNIFGGYSDIDNSWEAFFSDTNNLVCNIRLNILDNVNETLTYLDFTDIVLSWKQDNTLFLQDTNSNVHSYIFPTNGHQFGIDLTIKSGLKVFGYPYTNFFNSMSVKVDKYQWVNSTKVWQSVEIVEQLSAGFYLDTFIPKEQFGDFIWQIRYLDYIGISTNTEGKLGFFGYDLSFTEKTPVSLIDNQYYFFDNLPNLMDVNFITPSNIVCGTLGFIIVGEYMYIHIEGINTYTGFFNVDFNKIFTNAQNYNSYTASGDIGTYLDNTVLKEFVYHNYNNYYTNNNEIIYYDNDLYINCAKVNFNNSVYKLVQIKIVNIENNNIDFERKYLIVDNNYFYVDGANYLFSELLNHQVESLPLFNIDFYKVDYQTIQYETLISYDGDFILRYLSVNDNANINNNNNNDNGVIPPNNGGGSSGGSGGNVGNNSILNFFDLIRLTFDSIIPFFNIAILPNITLGFLIFFPLMISILIFIITLFKR